MKDVIELAKQAGIRWDTDIDRSEWLVRRDELERLYALVRNAALEEAKQLFSQPHQEYFGREAQDAIESLKEPTP